MFGGSKRRARPQAQPLTRETADPNAATAAASAFLSRQRSQSLSSAAAAAALKARPITPTNVSQVQSKRAVRRSASLSTTTRTRSRDRGGSIAEERPNLKRNPSSGSMTERTFRSPSPAGRGPTLSQRDIPPVPSLYNNNNTSRNNSSPNNRHARSQSAHVHTQSFRTASQSLRGDSWHGAARVGDLSNIRTADSVLLHGTGFSSAGSDGSRAGSVSPSINFSYPRARPGSPSLLSSGGNEVMMVYDANSRRMVPKVVTLEVEPVERTQSLRLSDEDKTGSSRRRKQTNGTSKRIGSLSGETVDNGHKINGISSEAHTGQSLEAWQTEQRGLQKSTTPQTMTENNSRANGSENLDMQVSDDAEITTCANPGPSRAPSKKKGPSLVNAKSETDDCDEFSSYHADIDAIPVRSSKNPTYSNNKDVKLVAPEIEAETEKSDCPQQSDNNKLRTRVPSESPARSPARSARIGPASDQMLVRHDPPPRSLSPRKSAMKQSTNNNGGLRCASPSDDGSEVSSSYLNNAAEQARKKAARVSFSEESVILGEGSEATPEVDTRHAAPSSPLAKSKSWLSRSGSGKQGRNESLGVQGEETMSPRPALPLFGSVRDKKPRGTDNERPLVRPSERTWSPTSTAISTEILSDMAARKPEANISRAREPLLPVVQSVEGSGYVSSSIASTDDEEDDIDHFASSQTPQTTQSTLEDIPEVTTPKDTAQEFEQASENGSAVHYMVTTTPPKHKKSGDIPCINIIDASPRLRDSPQTSPEAEFFEVSTETRPVESSPMGDIKEEGESDDNNSIYSDCYEELSSSATEDVDADGFMSLDAVVDAQPQSKLYEKTTAHSRPDAPQHPPTEAPSSADATTTTVSADTLSTPDDWENAKAYWRNLSAEQRRRLEREAGDEADHETSPPRSKKIVSTKKPKSSTTTEKQRPSSGVYVDHHSLPNRVYQIQPGTSWTAATNTNTNDHDATTTSSTTNTTMRRTLRNGPTKSPTHIRASSAQPPSHPTRSSTRRTASTDGPRPTSSSNPTLTSLQNNNNHESDSDSESSFKRAPRSRSRSTTTTGFRKTMRTTPDVNTTTSSSRFSLRSLSPSGSTTTGGFHRSTLSLPSDNTSSSRMKHSLRQAQPPQPQPAQKKRFSLIGGMTSSGKKKKKSKERPVSRFASSSDDDDDVVIHYHQNNNTSAGGFTSRFADSSDDDDEQEQHQQQNNPLANSELQSKKLFSKQPAPPHLDTSTTTTRPSQRSGSGHAHHHSILSTLLLRRKKQSTSSSSNKIISRRSHPLESAARLDTRLERSSSHLSSIRSTTSSSHNHTNINNHNHNHNALSWPLVPDNKNNNNDDGDGDDDDGHSDGTETTTTTTTVRKKKFPRLRKVFGLEG